MSSSGELDAFKRGRTEDLDCAVLLRHRLDSGEVDGAFGVGDWTHFGRRISESELRRLVFAIRSAIGIEALVWLTDVAGLSREEAIDLMRWSARALLRSALSDAD